MHLELEKALGILIQKKGSDLFVVQGSPLSIKVNGSLESWSTELLDKEKTESLLSDLLDDEKKEQFRIQKELNFAIHLNGVRFRVNLFVNRGGYGAVFRRIESVVPELQALRVPDSVSNLCMARQGLILLVGATGAGKSSTLASVIQSRNRSNKEHILCIEDPIEFFHSPVQSIVTQREVGVDTVSYEEALKNALRQAPDVILIGEIRNARVMKCALEFAETGHLCFATLHASSASQTFERILSFFEHEHRQQIWFDLALHLKGIVAQRLIPVQHGASRIAVFELLVNTPYVTDRLLEGDTSSLLEYMANNTDFGMCTFDQSLYKLYKEGLLDEKTALKYANSENDLRLMIKLDAKGNEPGAPMFTLQAKTE